MTVTPQATPDGMNFQACPPCSRLPRLALFARVKESYRLASEAAAATDASEVSGPCPVSPGASPPQPVPEVSSESS
ncbi:hypothetical protein F0U60_51450 [Archangium minus]|uniref:Uncharacterized protein n=1 Tax=Archangium minus TaxID=83450 RepID=A0ABY9X8E4_9BACT|nr:hypothetical protein F0U60_51450 [Archangium minus]